MGAACLKAIKDFLPPSGFSNLRSSWTRVALVACPPRFTPAVPFTPAALVLQTPREAVFPLPQGLQAWPLLPSNVA